MSNSQTPEPGTERALRSSVRNPRRRQRQSDSDTLKSAPRRKRSKISEDMFVPPRHDEEVNESIEVAPANGNITTTSPKRGRGRPRKEATPMMDVQMPVRERKTNSLKRPPRGDGAKVLAQNARYSVKMLPSTPKELGRNGVEYRGSLGAAHHALAVTREKAFIWDYNSHAPVNNPRTFDIPFPIKQDDPLPFGILVTSGASTDIGLVLVSSTSAKIVFYDSIERAASLGLFQERKPGVEGSLGSLFSGETVTDLISAGHAGFIVTLSSGRIAQLTLRDAQGKARVFTQFLRATDQSSSGLIGSLKGFWGASWKRNVTAIHTRSLGTRGQMQVISLTERVELQTWDLDWSGRYDFKGTLDFREMIARELKKVESPELEGQVEEVAALDFAIVEKPVDNDEVTTLGAEIPIDLTILLRVGTPDNCTYSLMDVSVEGLNTEITGILQLETHDPRGAPRLKTKPSLVLPKPGHTALVAFDDAIVLAQMIGAQMEGPEAQFHASYIHPLSFEDSIYLQQNKDLEILGVLAEDGKGSQATCIAFIKSAGLVRVSAVEPAATQQEPRIPIKSKIEQAVFHGALQDGSVLDFARVGDSQYHPKEVESAALTISDEVLKSTSPYISTSPTSIEAHLAYKTQALRALVAYVRQNYPALSTRALWRLLWDAEKVAAAQQLWKAFEEHVAASSKKKRTATVLDEVCALLQREIDPKSQESASDEVVHAFFIHSLHRIERLLPMTRNFLKYMYDEKESSPETRIRLANEADDVWIKAIEAVFAFRAESAAAYGVLSEFLSDGVLVDIAGYSELPEFWTSTESMLKAVVDMANVSRNFAIDEWEKIDQNPEMAEILRPSILHLNSQNPRLIELLCSIYHERINWLASRPDEHDRALAEKLRRHYAASRNDQFRALAGIAQTEAGLQLAQKYKDMHTLTEMVVAETQFLCEELEDAVSEQRSVAIHEQLDEYTRRIGTYFERFGEEWANAYFDEGFSGSKPGLLFQKAQEHWQAALTAYLRADPSRAKLCWINDITAGNYFEHATECLALVAKKQESSLWNKKVELSMSKLALLASQEGGTAMDKRLDVTMPQRELEVVDVQDQLHQHMIPEIRHCIDHQAELEVSMQKFALKNQDLHALKRLLENSLERVLEHFALSAEELIDVLTLMDSIISDEAVDENLQGQEFFLALKVLNAAAPDMSQERFETLLQLIWKRCYIYDDWIALDSAKKKSKDEVDQMLSQTAPWRTLFYIFDQEFFKVSKCYVRHLLPSQCIGAGCIPEDLSYRWPDPDLLDAILHDNKIQDEQLQNLITDRRLDQWIVDCVGSAKATVEAKGEAEANRLAKEREFEEQAWMEEKVNGAEANGYLNGIKVEESDGADDGILGKDGDVEMA